MNEVRICKPSDRYWKEISIAVDIAARVISFSTCDVLNGDVPCTLI
ncbi:MAG: hypothetical protein QXP70_00210 [Methanomassiliicoccales archaeon]